MIRTQRGRGGQRIHRGGHQGSVTSREKTPDNKEPVKNNKDDNYNRGPSGSNDTGYRPPNYRGRRQSNVPSGDRRQVRNNENNNYSSGATGNTGYGFRNNKPRERTGDGRQVKINHDYMGYGPQNKNYQHDYTFNFQRRGSAEDNQARNANLGINGPERRTSHELQVPHGDENRYNSLGSRMQYYEDSKLYNNMVNYTNNGRGREYRAPQEFFSSAQQLSGRGQRWKTNNTTSLKSGTEDKLGSGDNQRNICTARDLLQEEYDIQAKEYAAKRRLKEIEIIQQKMIRLRFSSSFDLGHRLSERTGDSGDRDRMVQKLQEEYNHQSKQCAKEMSKVEARKKSLESARKMIGTCHTPNRYDTPLGSEFTPNENTGAVPKKKRGEGVLSEKKTKYKENEIKVPSDSRSSRSSTNTSQTTQRKWLFDTSNPVVSANGITTFIVKEFEVTDMSLFSPNSRDNNLREARRKMQENLDKELTLKKAEEERKKAESSKQLPNTKNTKLLKSAVQKPKTKDKAVGIHKHKNVTEKTADPSSAAKSTLQMGFKEIGSVQIPEFNVIPKQSVARNNAVLVLRSPKNEAGVKKPADKTDTTIITNGFNVQVPCVLTAMETIDVDIQKPSTLSELNVQEPCVLTAMETMEIVNLQKNEVEPGTKEPIDSKNDALMVTNGVPDQIPYGLTAVETTEVNFHQPHTLIATEQVKDQNKENENNPDACKDTKLLSIQDQLRLRAYKLNKEYEEQYEQLILASSSSKPDYEEQFMQASTSSKPDHEEQFQPYNSFKPTSSKPAQNVVNEVANVPLIRNLNQINEYDRTGIVPKVIEYFLKSNRLFTTEGSDSCGRPVLKLRVN